MRAPGLTRLYTTLRDTPPAAVESTGSSAFAARFKQAMDDDFNTADACAVLFDLATQVNRSHSAHESGLLKALAGLLGLSQLKPDEFLRWTPSAKDVDVDITGVAAKGEVGTVTVKGHSDDAIQQLIEARSAARKDKNFAESDRIRDQLLAAGIVLEDGPGGTTWRRR